MEKGKFQITQAEEVRFLNKGAPLKELEQMLENSHFELDVKKICILDYDVLEILDEFAIKAKHRKINVQLVSEKRDF